MIRKNTKIFRMLFYLKTNFCGCQTSMIGRFVLLRLLAVKDFIKRLYQRYLTRSWLSSQFLISTIHISHNPYFVGINYGNYSKIFRRNRFLLVKLLFLRWKNSNVCKFIPGRPKNVGKNFKKIKKLIQKNFRLENPNINCEKTVFYLSQYKNLLKQKFGCYWPFSYIYPID